jgi:hypothetical protein
MAEQIPANAIDLFQKPALAHLATMMPGSQVQRAPARRCTGHLQVNPRASDSSITG